MATEIPYNRELEFEYGKAEQITPLIRRVIARNPSAFTFHGTGTYIIGTGQVAIVDPGPDLAEHVDALLNALRGETVSHILVTHTHTDHSPAVKAVQAATGAPSYAYGPHGTRPKTVPAKAVVTMISCPIIASAMATWSPARAGRWKRSTRRAIARTICASPCARKTRCSAATT